MGIGQNIRKRRLELKLSQQDLADALSLKTRSSIAKIENNITNVSQDKLLMIANFLNTNIDYLLTGVENNNTTNINNIRTYNSKNICKCVAVILAGGKYRLNKHNIPYQFVSINKKPVIIYTMETYQRHPLVDEMYVVCLDGWEDFLYAYANKYNITKFKGVIKAGKYGIQSIKNAIDTLTQHFSPNDIILLQESTRPLVDNETISSTVKCCKKNNSAVTYTNLEDTTPFLMNKDKNNITPIDAYSLITVQSPEAYTLELLKNAFNKAKKTGHQLTETICSIFMHNLGYKLSFCEGNHNNIRIVYDDDIKLFENLF